MAQRRIVSLQIPPDAVPGDTISFVVDDTELELTVPEGSSSGEVLEIQVGGSGSQEAPRQDEKEEEEEVTRIQLNDNKILLLHHHVSLCDNDNDNNKNKDETDANDADGTHAMPWHSGIALVKGLGCLPSDTQQAINDSKTVLELGSGLGLVGLAMAASIPASATKKSFVLTDCLSAMALLKHNIELNRDIICENVTVSAQVLNWESSDAVDGTSYDLIVGSDLLYNVKLIPALVSTLKRHAKKRVLLAVRWRKPQLERTFFEETSKWIDWKLLSLDESCSCTLSWEEYGDPANESSNIFFLQTMVAVQGMLTPLAHITEFDERNMSKEEHDAWERLQVQVYEGTVKSSPDDEHERGPKLARVEEQRIEK